MRDIISEFASIQKHHNPYQVQFVILCAIEHRIEQTAYERRQAANKDATDDAVSSGPFFPSESFVSPVKPFSRSPGCRTALIDLMVREKSPS
jgi:hypothetical protein